MKEFEKLQSLLPLGYLYLVVLGILKESVFFYQLGIAGFFILGGWGTWQQRFGSLYRL
ncbi:hypothetical protein SAMN05421780_1169 [Flexibacter flexilis DSM 6793]|uniref:Uncharacterized protein n=1 Tax=Flexibacter flexilis DSM 6793 TaxID=927664 RepID=A0A1I1NR60_9BACT|nr:hypothetical protein [Flexibacter flexilis]SFC98008.1 hypothetical protein SAMN05421780_1169 [Flexibacter flexilis DSM 6793]